MVEVNLSFPDFSSGELSPKVYGRHDLAAYYKGGRRVENFIVQTTGPAFFRTGTVFASRTRDNLPALLYTFEFTESVSFVLEFTNLKVRFYRNNGPVLHTAQNITGITQANPAVVTYSGSDTYANGDRVWIDGVVGMTQVNGREFEVANVNTGANTFELSGVNSTGYTAYSSGGTVAEIVEVTTPFATADLFQLKFAQQGAIMYIAHPSYNPQTLTYTSATSWAMANHSPTGLTLSSNNYPGAVGFYEQRLVYAGSNTNPNTLWFSKPANPGNFTVGTAVDDGISYTIAGPANKIVWLKGTNKFLAVGAFGDVYQVTGGIDGVVTPSSISIRPSNSYGTADINPIGKGTQVFFPQSNNLIIRSFEFDFQQDSYVPVDRNTIADHITKSGITQLTFQEGRPNILWATRTDGVLAGMTVEDLEAVSGWHRQVTDGDFTSVASLPRPLSYDQIWVCVKRNIDGTDYYFVEYLSDIAEIPQREDYITDDEEADYELYRNLLFEAQKEYIHVDSSLSYYGDDNAVTMTPGAVTGTGVTFTAGGAFFDASMVGREIWRKSVTGEETGRAEITGYTNNTTVTCTVLEDFDSTSAIPATEWYLTTDEVSGMGHLEGKTVTVCVDGGQHPEAEVTDAAIALDRQASVVHVGLGYIGYLETMDLEGGGVTGPAQTKRKSLHAIGVRFLNTLYAKFGSSYYKLREIEMRTAPMKMDRPPELFTGDRKEVYANDSLDSRDGGWQRSKRVIISQEQPFPCNVQLLIPYISVSN
jgi:hypothetical protein